MTLAAGPVFNVRSPRTNQWQLPPPGLYPYPRKRDVSTHIGHQNHLCKLIENGAVSLDDMRDIVKHARFICRKCGRVAEEADNLCEPDNL